MKAFVFDRDGVIVDSEYANIESMRYALKRIGITMDDIDADLIIGKHPADYIGPLSEKYGFTPDEHFDSIHYDKYRQLLAEVPLIEDTIDFIKQLHEKGIPLALCTSSSSEFTQYVLDRASISNCFKAIVTFEDYEHRKPHPDPYLTAAKKLGIGPEECIAVEDSVSGLQSAKSAGMKCIILESSYMQNHFGKENFANADLLIKSAKEIDVDEVMRW
jgi:HAD superfamily hydrolase (TIGR01509 family)